LTQFLPTRDKGLPLFSDGPLRQPQRHNRGQHSSHTGHRLREVERQQPHHDEDEGRQHQADGPAESIEGFFGR
jgi:hypothetical protein